MATIKIQEGKVILKDGKVSCACCGICQSVSFDSDSSVSPTGISTKISGGATVTLTGTNVDGFSMGWSMTATAIFSPSQGGQGYNFPATTVTVPMCLTSECLPQQYKQIVSIPDNIYGEIEFSFLLSGYDCCDSFSFSLECDAAP